MSPTHTDPAIVAWDNAVATEMRETHKPFSQAIRAIAERHPELHERYLTAFNALHAPTRRRNPDKREEQPAIPDAEAKWDREIEQKIAAGKTPLEAVRELVDESPQLHAAYLRAFNQAHKPKRS